MGKKVRDDEKPVTIAVCGFFTAAFCAAAMFSGAITSASGLFYAAFVVTFLLLVISWIFVLRNIFDPNYDKFRGAVIVLACIGFVLVMAQRNGWISEKQFKNDVEKAKQENALTVFSTLQAAITGMRQVNCNHIYVAVTPAEVQVKEPQWSGSDYLLPPSITWPKGKHEGPEIVCVKCFHKRKQIFDYGTETNLHIDDQPVGSLFVDSVLILRP